MKRRRNGPPGPPRLAHSLLRLVSPPSDRRFIEADLEEELERRQERDGIAAARAGYRGQVVRSVLPFLGRRLRGWLNRALERTAGKQGFRRTLLPNFVSDLSYGLRTLRKSPLVVVVTVLSLALGIGAVTSAFTIANAFLFKAHPGLEAPERLVTLYASESPAELYGPLSFPDFESVVSQVSGFEDSTAFRFGLVTAGGQETGATRRLMVEIVTGNYFEVLGIRPVLGNGFEKEQTVFGRAERVTVISHRMWQERYGGDRQVIGQMIELDGHHWTIVGVAPPGLTSRFLPLQVDAYLPLGVPGGVYHATPSRLANRRERDFQVMARLDQTTTLERVQSQLLVVADRLHQVHQKSFEDESGSPIQLTALSEADSRMSPDGRKAVAGVTIFLLGGTGLVLLIASSNVAGLLLARAQRRRHEMAVRLALGASRRRLMALLLSESLLLALAGGALGLLFAQGATQLLNVIELPLGIPLTFDFSFDHRVLLFAILLSMATCLLFGLMPASEGSKPNLIPSLKCEVSEDRKPRRFSTRNLLVIGQMAASLVFVVAAALLFRSLQQAGEIDLGFYPQRIAIMTKQLSEEEYGPEAALAHLEGLARRLDGFPEVEAAHLSRSVEHSLLAEIAQAEITVAGYQRQAGESMTFPYNSVTPGYVEMLGIRVLKGRTIQEADGPGAPLVAVVTESFVDRFWPGRNGLGERFSMRDRRGAPSSQDGPRSFEIVGVAADGKYKFVEEGGHSPFLWTSLRQDYSPFVVIHVKGRESAEAMIPLLHREVEIRANEVSIILPTTFESMIRLQYSLLGTLSSLLGSAGAFGLLLASIGVYGVVSFTVTQRRREMAIRRALGADSGHVFRSALGNGMILALCGLGVGLLIAIPGAMLVQSDLQGVSPLDPIAVGGSCLVLLLTALLASLVPAKRAAGQDPMETLRLG